MRRENNIKPELGETRCKDMDWIELAKDRAKWWALLLAVETFRFYCQTKRGSYPVSLFAWSN
jgi:hypothetical protein